MFRGAGKVLGYIFSVAKIFLFFLTVFFLPRFLVLYLHSNTYAITPKFKLGIENISHQFLKNITGSQKRLNAALITNQTGKNQKGLRTLDILLQKGFIIKKIFAPEHGISGKTSAGKDISDTIDHKTKLPIISLYGNGKTKGLTKQNIENIDILLFDIQDCGMRHYTYITALFKAMDAASRYGKKIIVLDRPNFLGPLMEGPLVDPSYKSSISYASIPLKYGMTLGELALYYNTYINQKPAQLYIVPMKEYNRNRIKKFLAPLSPNIQNINSCYGYSFLGLLSEIKPFYTGVGTNKAFQYILLPNNIPFQMQKWRELHTLLKEKYGIESIFYKQKKGKKDFRGLQITKFNDITKLSSFNLLITLIKFFQNSGVKLTFSPLFNKAIGTNKIIQYITGDITKNKLEKYINNNLSKFYSRAKAASCFIYSPAPKLQYAKI